MASTTPRALIARGKVSFVCVALGRSVHFVWFQVRVNSESTVVSDTSTESVSDRSESQVRLNTTLPSANPNRTLSVARPTAPLVRARPPQAFCTAPCAPAPPTLPLAWPLVFLRFHHHAPPAITSTPPPMMTARAHGGKVAEAVLAGCARGCGPKSRGESKGSQYLRSHTRHTR